MRKKFLRVVACLMVVLMTLTAVPVGVLADVDFGLTASAANIVVSGKCGENVNYTLDTDGILIISGTGKMENYDWDYGNLIKSVVIEDGVTNIGDGAFSGCEGIKNITIPDSVTSIGDRSFSGCEGIKNITIPDSVASIGKETFRGCANLAYVTVGAGLTNIGCRSFEGCSKLSKLNWNAVNCSIVEYEEHGDHFGLFGDTGIYGIQVVFGNSVKMIPSRLLSGVFCDIGIKSVVIGNNVTAIGEGAFSRCTGLTSITIPGNVIYIGDDAFYNCKELSSAIISNGVTNIGSYSFYGCSRLKDIVIPDSVTIIGDDAFYDCTALKTVTIGNGVETIGENLFANCKKLSTIKIGKNVKKIEKNAFKGLSEIPEILYAGSESDWEKVSINQSNNLFLLAPVQYNVDIRHEHSYTSTVTKQPSCTEKGLRTYICSCGYSYTETIPATGHKKVAVKGKLATCTEDGFTDGKKCSVCGTVLEAQKAIPAKGHSPVTVKGKPATCKQDGYTYSVKCSVCDEILIDKEPIKSMGHTFGSWRTAEEVTYTDQGLQIRTCAVCGKTETKTIEKLKTTAISKCTFSTLKPATYTGKAIAPKITVKNGKTTLKAGTHYTVSYKNNTKIGKATVTIKGVEKNGYTGTKTLTFNILPGVTKSLKATQSTSAIKLTWSKVAGATGYRVFRYDTKSKKWVKLADTKNTTYTVSKLKAGTNYKYAVKAYTTVGKTVYWSASYAQISTATKPATPTVKVSAGKKQATLSWNKVTGASGYVVYYSTSKNGEYKKLATTKSNYYTAKKLTTGKTYYFKVAAYKTVGKVNIYGVYSSVKGVKVK